MDTAFTHLLAMLCDIADPRRAEGKLYGLPHVFLFSILAVMAGANSYRAIHSFIDVHLHRLKQTFGLNWRRAPAYTTVRGILGMSRLLLKFVQQALLVEQATQPWPSVQGRG